MSKWRDTIKARSVDSKALTGSLGGALFIVPSSEGVFGRRTVLHEYPQRDTPWVEDSGRKGRQFPLEVFVDRRVNPDYQVARDALIVVLEKEGPHTLVHPWYGTMTVSLLEPASVQEITGRGGRATFRLVLVEDGGLIFPSSSTDTSQETNDRADDALGAVEDDFLDIFDTDGLPDWGLAEMADDVYTTLAELEEIVDGASGRVAAEIRTPANVVTSIVGSIQRIEDSVTEPLRAISLYKRLFGAGSDSRTIRATTPVRRQQATSTAALQRLTRQTAVIEACRVSSKAEFETRDEALETSAMLLAAMDSMIEGVDPVSGEPISDAVYQQLAALRAAVAIDLRTRGARLPELTTYTPPATLPALVVAHQVYGDATREQEIIERNRIGHPGFVPGGEALEILHG
ncbi:MAG: hypothetical protein C0613_08295 [Desulfobulbaceae bacterium]|nr:MAG: hypothetical protein C0613_08295 [Desulfobulbaceae bacterium]